MLKMERFEVPGLAHYSYVIWSGAQAAVVDPKRDFDTYVEFARARDLRITHILETHIHADYASGAKELAGATGAELWLSPYDRVRLLPAAPAGGRLIEAIILARWR